MWEKIFELTTEILGNEVRETIERKSVPGGWLYHVFKSDTVSTVFVPAPKDWPLDRVTMLPET